MDDQQQSRSRRPALDYESIRARPVRWLTRKRSLIGTIVFLAIAGFSSYLFFKRSVPTDRNYNLHYCAKNLHNIAIACFKYANDNGKFPDRLEDLMVAEEMGGDCFVCPSTADTPVQGTPQQQAAILSAGGNCSYIYVGKGFTLNMPAPAKMVAAYENAANHHGKEMNVLFADGHVEAVAVKSAAELFAKFPPPAIPKTTPAIAP